MASATGKLGYRFTVGDSYDRRPHIFRVNDPYDRFSYYSFTDYEELVEDPTRHVNRAEYPFSPAANTGDFSVSILFRTKYRGSESTIDPYSLNNPVCDSLYIHYDPPSGNSLYDVWGSVPLVSCYPGTLFNSGKWGIHYRFGTEYDYTITYNNEPLHIQQNTDYLDFMIGTGTYGEFNGEYSGVGFWAPRHTWALFTGTYHYVAPTEPNSMPWCALYGCITRLNRWNGNWEFEEKTVDAVGPVGYNEEDRLHIGGRTKPYLDWIYYLYHNGWEQQSLPDPWADSRNPVAEPIGFNYLDVASFSYWDRTLSHDEVLGLHKRSYTADIEDDPPTSFVNPYQSPERLNPKMLIDFSKPNSSRYMSEIGGYWFNKTTSTELRSKTYLGWPGDSTVFFPGDGTIHDVHSHIFRVSNDTVSRTGHKFFAGYRSRQGHEFYVGALGTNRHGFKYRVSRPDTGAHGFKFNAIYYQRQGHKLSATPLTHTRRIGFRFSAGPIYCLGHKFGITATGTRVISPYYSNGSGDWRSPSVWSTSRLRHYWEMRGSYLKIDDAAAFTPSNDMTIVIVFRPTTIAAGTSYLISKYDNDNVVGREWYIERYTAAVRCDFQKDGSTGTYVDSPAILDTSYPHFFAARYKYVADNTSIVANYLNGAHKRSVIARGPVNNTSAPIIIGGLWDNSSNAAINIASMDLFYVAIYSSYLDVEQIEALWRETVTPDSLSPFFYLDCSTPIPGDGIVTPSIGSYPVTISNLATTIPKFYDYPQEGAIVTIRDQHIVEIDSDVTLGTSPNNNTTNVLTIQDGGTLKWSDDPSGDWTLDIKGNVQINGGLVRTPFSGLSLQSGLVAYYPLDIDTRDSVARRDGVLCSSASLSRDTYAMSSGYLNVTANSNSCVDLGRKSAWEMTSAISLSCWLYRNSANANDEYIVAKATSSSSHAQWALYRQGSTGKIIFGIKTGGTWREILSTTLPGLSSWYHLVATYDGSLAKLYVNNVLEGSASATGTIDSLPGMPVYIGGCATGTSSPYADVAGTPAARIDEVGIWNRALNTSEIGYLYGCRDPGLNTWGDYATRSYSRISGAGGVLQIGSSEHPIPDDKTAILKIASPSYGQWKLVNNGTLRIHGAIAYHMAGENSQRTKLVSSIPSGIAVFQTEDYVNWEVGDTILVGCGASLFVNMSMQSLYEETTIIGRLSPSTYMAAFTSSHSTGDHLVLANRNVTIRGNDSTHVLIISSNEDWQPTLAWSYIPTVDIRWTELLYCGDGSLTTAGLVYDINDTRQELAHEFIPSGSLKLVGVTGRGGNNDTYGDRGEQALLHIDSALMMPDMDDYIIDGLHIGGMGGGAGPSYCVSVSTKGDLNMRNISLLGAVGGGLNVTSGNVRCHDFWASGWPRTTTTPTSSSRGVTGFLLELQDFEIFAFFAGVRFESTNYPVRRTQEMKLINGKIRSCIYGTDSSSTVPSRVFMKNVDIGNTWYEGLGFSFLELNAIGCEFNRCNSYYDPINYYNKNNGAVYFGAQNGRIDFTNCEFGTIARNWGGNIRCVQSAVANNDKRFRIQKSRFVVPLEHNSSGIPGFVPLGGSTSYIYYSKPMGRIAGYAYMADHRSRMTVGPRFSLEFVDNELTLDGEDYWPGDRYSSRIAVTGGGGEVRKSDGLIDDTFAMEALPFHCISPSFITKAAPVRIPLLEGQRVTISLMMYASELQNLNVLPGLLLRGPGFNEEIYIASDGWNTLEVSGTAAWEGVAELIISAGANNFEYLTFEERQVDGWDPSYSFVDNAYSPPPKKMTDTDDYRYMTTEEWHSAADANPRMYFNVQIFVDRLRIAIENVSI